MASVHDGGEARSAMADGCGGLALCAEKARGGNGAVSAFGQELALFWSTDAQRGAFGRACVPRGEKLLRRSAMMAIDHFLKMVIQSLIDPTDSEYSSCQHG